jgi:hypothetical protein
MFNQMPMYYGTSQNNRMPSYYGNTGDTPNQMPYAYGMMNENPLPLNPSPISALPPLFPSMLTPQLNPQAPFTSQNLMQARYAHGGSVHPRNLSEMAELIREEGDEDDSILAHINPEEAEELSYSHGMDINPLTGLPQFGRAKRFFKRLGRKAIPFIGAAIGNAILPGVGGVLGGAAGNALRAKTEHKDPFKAALRGAGIGAGLGFGMPLLGSGLSSLGATNIGGGLSAIGGGQYGQGLSALKQAFTPGATQGFVQGATRTASGAGPLGSLMKNTGFGTTAKSLYPTAEQSPQKGGFFSDILGQGGLSNLLLPAALIGTAMRKEKMKPAYEQPSFEKIASMTGPQSLRKMWGPEDMPRPVTPFERKRLEVPSLTEEMLGLKPYHYSPYYEEYATGGQVAEGGYMQGGTKGQDDKIPAYLSDGEFVIPADVVSAQGDGNNAAGARQFYEYISRIRNHKGQKNKLPPKAKSLMVYMQQRSR